MFYDDDDEKNVMMQRVGLVIGLVGCGVWYMAQQTYRWFNHVETPAYVKSVKTDCYLSNKHRRFLVKGTKKLAYMKCADAQKVARKNGYGRCDIRKRIVMLYSYKSPVNGRHYSGTHAAMPSPYADTHAKGQKITISAHKNRPAQSRFN